MSHAYPLAKNGRAALKAVSHAARSRAEADRLAEDLTLQGLETDWLTVTEDELTQALEVEQDGPGHGYLQHYEDANGELVLAVTYWKLKRVRSAKPKPAPTPPKPANEDHTDDLYFKHRKSRRKPKPVDPNQLTLFDPPPAKDG